MNSIRAATVQFNHQPGHKPNNRAKVESFVAKANELGVQLIVFPEMCITGYWHVRKLGREQVAALAEPVPSGESTQWLMQLASDQKMTIGVGLIEVVNDGTLYNSYIVAMPNGQVHTHRKLHCFISPHMQSGNEYTVFDTPDGCRVGVLICYDNNIVENVRATALMGAEVLLAPHQTGGCQSLSPRGMTPVDWSIWERRHEDPEAIQVEFQGPKGRAWLMRWLPARAHDNGLFVLYSNGVGPDDDEIRTGNAMILDPYGEIITETNSIEDDIVVADLDPTQRDMCTGLRWITARRPELYGVLTTATGMERDARSARFATSLTGQVDRQA